MSSEGIENPVATGTVKVQGVLYQKGETVPADKVDPDRLTRLVAKGLLGYGDGAGDETPADDHPADEPDADKPSADQSDAGKAETSEKPVKQPAKNRAEAKAGRPDLKLPEDDTGE